jgi:GT2 family glycosyltransferase
MSGAHEVDVSVVVPAYYGASTITACLQSIHRATAGRRREIIVVDSSGDETAEIVGQGFPGVTFISSNARLSVGAARNLGLSRATGRLIFFTDQDCVVPPDWIDRLERHFADQSIGAAGGSLGIRNLSNLSGCAVYFLEFLTHFPMRGAPTRNRNFLLGCNGAYRAETLGIVRFPEQTLGEDVLFSERLMREGIDVVYDPSVEVRHQNREGWGEFFNYNRKMGRAAASYHRVLRRPSSAIFLRAPILVFGAPLVILPRVGFRLLRSRWSYFWRFVLLSPMCLAGNLVWAKAFRREVLEGSKNG